MHLCIQLDWFPSGSGTVRESTMEVDWVREYDLSSSQVYRGHFKTSRSVQARGPGFEVPSPLSAGSAKWAYCPRGV